MRKKTPNYSGLPEFPKDSPAKHAERMRRRAANKACHGSMTPCDRVQDHP